MTRLIPILLLTACAPSCARQDPRPPPDLSPLLDVLEVVAPTALRLTAAGIESEARRAERPAVCAAAYVSAGAVRAIAHGIEHQSASPEARVDVTECGLPLEPIEVPPEVWSLVDVTVAAVTAQAAAKSDTCAGRNRAEFVARLGPALRAAIADEMAAPDGVSVVASVPYPEPCDTDGEGA